MTDSYPKWTCHECAMKDGGRKTQSRKMSAVETLSNTAIGFMIALGTQITVFPWFELSVPIHDNILLTVIFTVVSVVRGYCVRRLFNKIKKRITPPQLLLSEIRERTD